MDLTNYIILFLSTVLGGFLAFTVKDRRPSLMKHLTTFSGAFILGVVFIHILPSVYSGAVRNVGIYILLGFVLQFLLEHLAHGHDHGHSFMKDADHNHHHHSTSYAIMLIAGLSLHSFMDGIPVAGVEHLHDHGHSHGHSHEHNHLLWAMFLHKIPDAFALVLIMLDAGIRRLSAWLLLLAFACISPLGAWVMTNWGGSVSGPTLVITMAVLMGAFMHIGTTILFETESYDHSLRWRKLAAIVLGFGVASVTVMI